MKKNTSSSQVLVNTTVRKKRGPSNKLSKKKRLDKVRELYFEEEYSIVDVAKNLGVHRNTITSDVQYWIDEFDKQGMGDKTTEFFYKQKTFLESQKRKLLKKVKTESDFDSQNKIVKILLGLHDRQVKLHLKFSPMVRKSPKISKKLVKKIIQEFAFDEFSFSSHNDLIKQIIRKTKCDVDTAKSIVDEMRKLGLDYTENPGIDYTSLLDLKKTSMMEFANMCGYFSDEKYSKILEENAQRREQAEKDYEESLSKYIVEFAKKYGDDSKNWSKEVRKKYCLGLPELDDFFS